MAIIHGLLRGDSVTFHGQYYDAENAVMRPRGPRPVGIPIMIGVLKTNAPRMFELLAKYGDIWNAWARQTVAEIEADREAVDAAMTRAGRDPATVERTVSLLVDLPTSTGRPTEEKQAMRPREPEELAEHLFNYANAGISHVQLMLDPNTMDGIEWAAEALELLDK
jgi:alkanesulfonate monooxygenase SsuD/methylene tetrahydromethanopterin reductase-like flavin-dependent oxidoreductase (luciferase family)